MWIVKIPKHYRENTEMARFIGPFSSFMAAEAWVRQTFEDYEQYLFIYHQVFKP